MPKKDLIELAEVQRQIVSCRRCPRLVEWREGIAQKPPLRYREKSYWAKPVPSFGDPAARLLIVGLAPGAHGSNRTGRMFTGDGSGNWLYRALFRAGFASQPESREVDDGLELCDAYITAACHCAPPQNKVLPSELANCRPFLLRELELLTQIRVLLGLGKVGFDATFNAAKACGLTELKPRPAFGHGVEVRLNDKLMLVGAYHPSQQNTFTGKLTEPMFDAVFERIRALLND